MRKKKLKLVIALFTVVCYMFNSAFVFPKIFPWQKNSKIDKSIEETKKEEKNVEYNIEIETEMKYTSGDGKNQRYLDLRHEFPLKDGCYLTIGDKAIVDKAKFSDKKVKVIYRF